MKFERLGFFFAFLPRFKMAEQKKEETNNLVRFLKDFTAGTGTSFTNR